MDRHSFNADNCGSSIFFYDLQLHLSSVTGHIFHLGERVHPPDYVVGPLTYNHPAIELVGLFYTDPFPDLILGS